MTDLITKVIPSIKKQKKTTRSKKKNINFPLMLALIGTSFLVLLLTITVLALPYSLKLLALLLGNFIIVDILHSFKAYVRQRIDSSE